MTMPGYLPCMICSLSVFPFAPPAISTSVGRMENSTKLISEVMPRVPRSTSLGRLRLVAAMTRTLQGWGSTLPTGVMTPSSSARRSLG